MIIAISGPLVLTLAAVLLFGGDDRRSANDVDADANQDVALASPTPQLPGPPPPEIRPVVIAPDEPGDADELQEPEDAGTRTVADETVSQPPVEPVEVDEPRTPAAEPDAESEPAAEEPDEPTEPAVASGGEFQIVVSPADLPGRWVITVSLNSGRFVTLSSDDNRVFEGDNVRIHRDGDKVLGHMPAGQWSLRIRAYDDDGAWLELEWGFQIVDGETLRVPGSR